MAAPIVRQAPNHQRRRGSVVDSLTLEEVLFQWEPKSKSKDSTKYAQQNIVGKRLANTSWVGGGTGSVEFDITLSAGGHFTPDQCIEQLKNFTQPQTDTGAPHPVYLNIGDIYVGRLFVLVDVDTTYLVHDYADTMATRDAKVRLKFEEIPVS